MLKGPWLHYNVIYVMVLILNMLLEEHGELETIMSGISGPP